MGALANGGAERLLTTGDSRVRSLDFAAFVSGLSLSLASSLVSVFGKTDGRNVFDLPAES